MKKYLLALLCLAALASQAQKKTIAAIEKQVSRPEAEAILTFLSADEMRGRNTGSPEIDIAANYIASRFRQWQLSTVAGAENYFQPVQLSQVKPPSAGTLQIDQLTFAFKEHFIALNGNDTQLGGEIVFAGYGAPEEITPAVKGKIVVVYAGIRGSTNPMEFYTAGPDKLKRVAAAGGLGLVELLTNINFPWSALVNYFGSQERFGIQSSSELPHLLMKDQESLAAFREKGSGQGSLTIQGVIAKTIPARNVAARIQGTDPVLRNETIVISAHYDHVGVSKPRNGQDSIFNGARDNAIGVTAMLSAAHYFSLNPPKRSLLFLAFTGEEKGLLGSAWYADHPLIPLEQTVFNFDCDGAGYNDKSLTTVIGLERTSAETDIASACKAFGLTATKDPVPEQNLYERSDNYNFARKGVPAIDFAPGIKAFDEELMKYYHQPADEVASLDFDYLMKYFKAFVYANHLLANNPKTPFWNAGDKFEPVGKALYKK
ncbi:MAG: M28 family peptidase [Cyclobacteriaceae bacterium]|nr:M28 family peptidase [Cyclobacteriaceae bacterium]